MSNLHLKQDPTLADYQSYLHEMVIERGFTKDSIEEIFMRLSEEMGELAKAVRKQGGFRVDPSSEKYAVAEEVADVFIYLLDVCNRFDIDLEEAFRSKEEKNKQRTWK